MKRFLLFLFTIIAGPAFAQVGEPKPSAEALEEKYGFRDARLESDTTAFKDLNLLGYRQPYGGLQTYWRTNDPKQIGEAQLEDINYYFYKGKLLGIAIMMKYSTDGQAFLAMLKAKYGEGQRAASGGENYTWSSKRVLLQYAEKPISGATTVIMLSKALDADKKAFDAAAAKKASGDL